MSTKNNLIIVIGSVKQHGAQIKLYLSTLGTCSKWNKAISLGYDLILKSKPIAQGQFQQNLQPLIWRP
jgi:hypothetical protein